MQPIQINIRALKALSFLSGKDEKRFHLKGIQIELHWDHLIMIATDGNVIGVIKQNYPAQETRIGEDCQSFGITSELLNKIKITRNFPDLIEFNSFEGAVSATIPDMGTLQSPKLGGTFPDWKRIVPRKFSNEPCLFDFNFLIKFQNAVEVLTGNKNAIIKGITFNGISASLINWVPSANNLEGFGLIMPMRQNNQIEAPAWVFS